MPFGIRYSVGDPREAHNLLRQGGVFCDDLRKVIKSEHFLLADVVGNPLKTSKARSQGGVCPIDVCEIGNRVNLKYGADAVG